MATKASEIMQRASVLLQDTGSVRWTAPELCNYLNDGQREIAILKPSAVSQTVEIDLVAGTRQTVPATYSAILNILRNVGGRAITTIDRRVLDMQMPGWQIAATLPYAAEVIHAIYEPESPHEFYVAPGNDGNGSIEVRVAVIPTDIPPPGSPLVIENYTTNIGVSDIYRAALTDYVLYRAYSKDGESPTAGQLAVAHYQAFTQAVGAKAATEVANSPATK